MSPKNNLSASLLLFFAAVGLLPAASSAQDLLSLSPAVALEPGAVVRVPLTFVDRSGTALGGANPLQGLAVTVAAAPPAAVLAVGFRRAGTFASVVPRFEIETGFPERRTWLISFPNPLPVPATSQIANLEVSLHPGLSPDSIVTLSLVAADTGVSNADGSVLETMSNGELELQGGTITVLPTGIFSDGFESGDFTRWTAVVP